MSKNEFIRMLKELGIYHIWKKNRYDRFKKFGYKFSNKKSNRDNFVPEGETLYDYVNSSFCWVDTQQVCLWIELSRVPEIMVQGSWAFNDKTKDDKLKKIIKENL